MERYSDEAIRILDDLHTERIDYHSEYLPLIDAVQRLDAYESTGMEPDDLKRIFNEDALLKMTGNFLGIAPDRLRELAQADREERCGVLQSVEYTEEDGENALKSAMHTCFYHNTPVTRYIADAVAEKLIREAVEKVLEEMEENENGMDKR